MKITVTYQNSMTLINHYATGRLSKRIIRPSWLENLSSHRISANPERMYAKILSYFSFYEIPLTFAPLICYTDFKHNKDILALRYWNLFHPCAVWNLRSFKHFWDELKTKHLKYLFLHFCFLVNYVDTNEEDEENSFPKKGFLFILLSSRLDSPNFFISRAFLSFWKIPPRNHKWWWYVWNHHQSKVHFIRIFLLFFSFLRKGFKPGKFPHFFSTEQQRNSKILFWCLAKQFFDAKNKNLKILK